MTLEAASRLLGLRSGVWDAATLRRAFRAKARDAHPDRGGSHEAFIELQRALEFLLSRIEGRDDSFESAAVWSPQRRAWVRFYSAEAIEAEFESLERELRLHSMSERDQDDLILRIANNVARDWNRRMRASLRADRWDGNDSLIDVIGRRAAKRCEIRNDARESMRDHGLAARRIAHPDRLR